MRRPALRPVAVALAVAALAACTGTGGPGPRESASPSPSEAAVDTGAVAATTTLHLAGADVEVEVLPLVRSGEHVVLTLDLAMEDAGTDDAAFLALAFGGIPVLQLPTLAGLRLVDLERDVVHTVAVDATGDTVTTGRDFVTLDPGATMRLQTAYAAPPEGVASLGLLVPGGAYVAEVPVVEGDVPPPAWPGAGTADDDAEAPEPLDLDLVDDAPVVGLESFTAELAGAVQTLTSTESVQVTLGSDVLFAVDSADLTDASREALDVAASHLEGREGGTVAVVGHTDDVASDEYNQELSERRAQAVAAALASRVDTSRFTVVAEGRGESEPLVTGADEASRALNRRVSLTLESTTTQTVEVTTEGELPPFEEGPVGTGAEGVVVDSTGTYRITADARRVHGHVVVDLHVTAEDEGATAGVSFLSGIWHYRGDAYSVQRSASGVVVLRGATVLHPLDHLDAVTAEGTEQWLPLTDLETLGTIALGGTRTFSVVYPELGDVDEVAVQVDPGLGSKPFRLTGIPVG